MAMRPSSKTMSFGEAFKAARAAGDDTFTWKGESFNTKMAAPRVSGPGRKPTPPDTSNFSNEGRQAMVDAAAGGPKRSPSPPDMRNQTAAGREAYAADRAAQLDAENFSNEGRGYKRGGRVTGYKGYGIAKKV